MISKTYTGNLKITIKLPLEGKSRKLFRKNMKEYSIF